MKLIIAIVQDEDASRLVSSLMNEGFGVTKLAHAPVAFCARETRPCWSVWRTSALTARWA